MYFLVLIATWLNASQRNGGGARLGRSARDHKVKQHFEQTYGLATILLVLYITIEYYCISMVLYKSINI